MNSQEAGPLCRVFLFGTLAITDCAGVDRTPKGQKVQALIAMLALAPRGTRSRVWLRDKLWSEREEEQAGASLRQALTELRKSLGPIARNVLIADNNTVSLDLSRVWIDIRALEHIRSDELDALLVRPDRELLEGIDVADPEFEDWLSLERQFWANRMEAAAELSATEKKGRSASQPGRHFMPAASPGSELRRSQLDARVRIGILPAVSVGGVPVSLGDRINELVAKGLNETGEISVTDLWSTTVSPDPAAGAADTAEGRNVRAQALFVVQCRMSSSPDSLQVTLCVRRTSDQSVVWIDSDRLPPQLVQTNDLSLFTPITRRALDGILLALAHRPLRIGNQDEGGAALILSAVERIFRLSEPDLRQAEQTLRAMIETAPSSQAYAWLAFLLTFRVGQRFSRNIRPLLDEAQALGRQALSLDPSNALSLSLVGHVHSYLFGEYDVAADLFERAIRINPAQPLSWDLYSMLHAYIGRPETGLRCARWARELGAGSPYRYYFDTSCCIAAALAGRHEEAVRIGQLVLQDRPQFNSILRYLVSSYAHLGDQAASHAILAQLKEVEPDFSIEALREAQYPLLRSECGAAFVDGLIKAGVPRATL